jgi:hypothetical protein
LLRGQPGCLPHRPAHEINALPLHHRLETDVAPQWPAGSAIAAVVSLAALGRGAHWPMRRLRLSPAMLLRGAGAGA